MSAENMHPSLSKDTHCFFSCTLTTFQTLFVSTETPSQDFWHHKTKQEKMCKAWDRGPSLDLAVLYRTYCCCPHCFADTR